MGHPSKPMKPGKVVAIPDNPPQVVLERPGADLVLNAPAKVPLSIAAYDDFGLSDIVVLGPTRGDSSGGFVGRPINQLRTPAAGARSALASLDVPAMDLKKGEHIRYRVEARDRKGQSAQTQEFVVRIAADNNAADKQLENYDKGQDAFRENLVKLIAEQAKVQESVKAMTAKYAPLEEKIKAAVEARPRPRRRPAARKSGREAERTRPRPPNRPSSTPSWPSSSIELQGAGPGRRAGRNKNAKLGEQVAAGLKQAAEQAANLKMLPLGDGPADAGGRTRRLRVEPRGSSPLQDLAAEMKQGSRPQAGRRPRPPPTWRRGRTARQRELEAVKDQLDAASKARKELPQDAEAAVNALREEMLRENAGLTARDLEDLKNFLKAREEELKRLEGQQADLAAAVPQAPEVLLPDVEKRQAELDPKEEKALADAQALLDAEKLRRVRKEDPDFPDAPFHPEGAEEMVPPKEEDPADPDAAKGADAHKNEGAAAEKKDDAAKAEDEPLFLPALGGPKPKLDPRFADKLRPVPPKAAAKGDHNQELDARREGAAFGRHQQASAPRRPRHRASGARQRRALGRRAARAAPGGPPRRRPGRGPAASGPAHAHPGDGAGVGHGPPRPAGGRQRALHPGRPSPGPRRPGPTRSRRPTRSARRSPPSSPTSTRRPGPCS